MTPAQLSPGKDQRYRILRITGSLKGTVTATSLDVFREDGVTPLWGVDISTAGPFDFDLVSVAGGLSVPRDEAASTPGTFSVVLGAAGAAVVQKLNVIYALEF